MTAKEFVFESSLSIEEIENNFSGMDFFSDLMEGLEESFAHSVAIKGNGQVKKRDSQSHPSHALIGCDATPT